MRDYKRFWEIDFLRGIAVILMIIAHLLFNLKFFFNYSVNYDLFWIIARFTATLFVFLVGVSLTLSYSKSKNKPGKKLFIKYLLRGLKLLGLGIIITLFTYIFFKEEFILFGVLHLIGLSVILSYPFLNKRYVSLITGIFFIILGLIFKNVTYSSDLLFLLGITSSEFHALDYFPLFPWFGIILVGIYFGNTFYKDYKRKFKIPDLSGKKLFSNMCFLGRNSLFIYFIHQPVLIIIMYLIFHLFF